MAQKKMILDLDVGVDDTLAIAYACGSPEVDLIGITCTYGNVLVEQSAKNALDVLHLFGRDDVPVFLGEPHAIEKDGFEVMEISAFIHGKNGIGEVVLEDSGREPEATPAVDFIIDAVHTYGEDLVYVPTGPETNMAVALQKDPTIADELGAEVLMGGALTVPGNVSPCCEANINQDPDAANLVFRSGIPATMVGLDVTLQTLLTYEDTKKWRECGTVAGEKLADITDYYIKAYETTAPYLGGCGLHDPLAVGVAIDPSLVTILPINLMVDTEGPTRGRTIGNPDLLNDPYKSMGACVEVDAPRFLDEFMNRITGLVAGCK
ncbi:nucleoside hydrolase [Olsenella sp. YH-ols2217]|uniref:Nucleoside hydrolase n=1 Tax=Kribbibacterium absianum TaxID=3044210 RepID=A0ABT6ZI17_9ACTN|nr:MULTISPECIES: nucleoside hydrolase [unclassified Olsenella]MDJ1121193.1 nucleoside hydrolase [Olsenella sp. YH-ols2216]MDJ1128684.1 nucleoside hydrolase [Olsenella sp. YH-ols2217]